MTIANKMPRPLAAFLLAVGFLAVVHFASLLIDGIRKGTLEPLNVFNIMELGLFWPNLIQGIGLFWMSVLAFGVIYAAMYLLLKKF